MKGFEKVKKKFGFGCMRLPMKGEDVDLEQFTKMVDLYMSKGFNYFDTAMVYLEGKSETAIQNVYVSASPVRILCWSTSFPRLFSTPSRK